ncbi:hypothetical protein [Methylomonas rivi]|uniref:Transposase DDE domain-containing protein n=1 Tax=Methylomonas rivi TaxID=2952226 RepID=A0ABT1UAX7_9GAMM|nr:hypothetical protein [Methylomonas sp. WSC-6]MCQ8130796.1 hypothetical protein [Methylomonas sp. WSC-6]
MPKSWITTKSEFAWLADLEKRDQQEWIAKGPSSLQIHCRKAVIEFRNLKATFRHCVQPTQTGLIKLLFGRLVNHTFRTDLNRSVEAGYELHHDNRLTDTKTSFIITG